MEQFQPTLRNLSWPVIVSRVISVAFFGSGAVFFDRGWSAWDAHLHSKKQQISAKDPKRVGELAIIPG
jgi:hypothetical protein